MQHNAMRGKGEVTQRNVTQRRGTVNSGDAMLWHSQVKWRYAMV